MTALARSDGSLRTGVGGTTFFFSGSPTPHWGAYRGYPSRDTAGPTASAVRQQSGNVMPVARNGSDQQHALDLQYKSA